MIGDDQTWLDAHRQPSDPVLNPLHALGHVHVHTPLLVIVNADMFPQVRMGGALALPRAAKAKAGVLTPRFFNQVWKNRILQGGQVIWSSAGNQSKMRENKTKERKLGES